MPGFANAPAVRFAIKGFGQQNRVSTSTVIELTDGLPRFHLAGLKSIVYAPAAQFAAMRIPIESSRKGAFYADYRSVILHSIDDGESFAHLLFHEIGHYVFHTVIGSYLKKEWVMKFSLGPPYATEYASTDKIEDFAECYALYAANRRDLLAKVPLRHRFMKEKVFRHQSAA